MIDPRIYRAAFVPALCALIVVMFSLEARPEPLISALSPDTFDRARAERTTRDLVKVAPDRRPGTDGAKLAAEFVAERFGAIEGGEVSIQRWQGSYRGKSAEMRNVILVLPGSSQRRVALIAHRDSPQPPGAVSSAAATGALTEVAATLGGSRHRKTIVIVSTDGASGGAAGVRRFAERFPGVGDIEAAVVLDQPAVSDLSRPLVVPWSSGPESTSIQLVQSAKSAVRREVGVDPGVEGGLGYFLRLALPMGLQEQAPLIERDIPAVTLTANGELPLPAIQEGPTQLSRERLGQMGRAALSLLLAVDSSIAPIRHGPGAYVVLAGNLVPGWSLALLGLAFVLPAGLAAVDGFARARRRREPVMVWVRWVLAGAIPFVAVLGVAHALSIVDWVPDPGAPFDPGRFPVDAGAVLALAALAAVFCVAWLVLRPLALPRLPGPPGGDGAAAAVGLMLTLVAVAVWVLNPYLALLLLPALHLWLFVVVPEARLSRWVTGVLIVAGLVAPILAFSYVADRLDVGWGILWQLVLMTTGGHIDLPEALVACLFGACLAAVLLVARAGVRARERPGEVTVRGPLTYAGPGSLGGTESALPR